MVEKRIDTTILGRDQQWEALLVCLRRWGNEIILIPGPEEEGHDHFLQRCAHHLKQDWQDNHPNISTSEIGLPMVYNLRWQNAQKYWSDPLALYAGIAHQLGVQVPYIEYTQNMGFYNWEATLPPSRNSLEAHKTLLRPLTDHLNAITAEHPVFLLWYAPFMTLPLADQRPCLTQWLPHLLHRMDGPYPLKIVLPIVWTEHIPQRPSPYTTDYEPRKDWFQHAHNQHFAMKEITKVLSLNSPFICVSQLPTLDRFTKEEVLTFARRIGISQCLHEEFLSKVFVGRTHSEDILRAIERQLPHFL